MPSKIISFTLNGREVEVMVKPLVTLLNVLRENLGYIATKAGCRRGHLRHLHRAVVNGEPMRSCILPVEDVEGMQVTTLEGLTRSRVCIRSRRRSTKAMPLSVASARRARSWWRRRCSITTRIPAGSRSSTP